MMKTMIIIHVNHNTNNDNNRGELWHGLFGYQSVKICQCRVPVPHLSKSMYAIDHLYICIYVCIYIYKQIIGMFRCYVCMYVCMYVCIYIYMCMCMCMCMCIYIYIYMYI